MISNEHRVAVVTGSAGVVARFGNDVVVIGGRSAAVTAAMTALVSIEGSAAGAELVHALQMAGDVDVAAIVHAADGFKIVTVGNGLVATPDGRPVDASSVAVWVGIGPVPSDAAGRLDAAPHLDLRGGSVPGQGAIVGGLAARTDPHAALPSIEPPAAPPGRPSSVIEGSEVLGIRCSREHFNNPKAAYCQVCGISMVHMTHYLVPGPRPTLGFLVFDDGATFALDRSYCVGREPLPDPSHLLTPLVLDDTSHSVSRSHAELVLDGWDLTIHDLGSTNGTFVWSDERQVWTRVIPGEPFTITPGTTVAIGRKLFVYESVARPM